MLYIAGVSAKSTSKMKDPRRNIQKSKLEQVVWNAIEYVRKGHVGKFYAKCRQYMMAYKNVENDSIHLTYVWLDWVVCEENKDSP